MNSQHRRAPWIVWVVLLVGACGAGLAFGSGQERIELTTPVITTTTIRGYAPVSLYLQLVPNPEVRVVIVRDDGKLFPFRYPCDADEGSPSCTLRSGDQVRALIVALNGANLSTRTLWRRLFERLVVDFPEAFPGGATVQ